MSTAETLSPADDEAHGPDHVHHYETGISEGNARLPRWFVAFLISLLAFAAYYVVAEWNAQPTSARLK